MHVLVLVILAVGFVQSGGSDWITTEIDHGWSLKDITIIGTHDSGAHWGSIGSELEGEAMPALFDIDDVTHDIQYAIPNAIRDPCNDFLGQCMTLPLDEIWNWVKDFATDVADAVEDCFNEAGEWLEDSIWEPISDAAGTDDRRSTLGSHNNPDDPFDICVSDILGSSFCDDIVENLGAPVHDIFVLFMQRLAVVQDKNIAEQLSVGVRYFDFRVCFDGVGKAHTCHTLMGDTYEHILWEIVNTLSSLGQDEILFLKFSHLHYTNKDLLSDDDKEDIRRELAREIYTILTDSILFPPLDCGTKDECLADALSMPISQLLSYRTNTNLPAVMIFLDDVNHTSHFSDPQTYSPDGEVPYSFVWGDSDIDAGEYSNSNNEMTVWNRQEYTAENGKTWDDDSYPEDDQLLSIYWTITPLSDEFNCVSDLIDDVEDLIAPIDFDFDGIEDVFRIAGEFGVRVAQAASFYFQIHFCIDQLRYAAFQIAAFQERIQLVLNPLFAPYTISLSDAGIMNSNLILFDFVNSLLSDFTLAEYNDIGTAPTLPDPLDDSYAEDVMDYTEEAYHIISQANGKYLTILTDSSLALYPLDSISECESWVMVRCYDRTYYLRADCEEKFLGYGSNTLATFPSDQISKNAQWELYENLDGTYVFKTLLSANYLVGYVFSGVPSLAAWGSSGAAANWIVEQVDDPEMNPPGAYLLQSIKYYSHCQSVGNTAWSYDGGYCGTKGQSLRMEGFQISILSNYPDLQLEYMGHVQNYGDTGWMTDGQFLGTYGESKRLEGFAIRVRGTAVGKYRVRYLCHVQEMGDSGWKWDGQFCGTRGQSRRTEGLQVQIYKIGNTCDSHDECTEDGYFCIDHSCKIGENYVKTFEGKTFSFPDWDNGAFTRIDGVIGWVPSWELIDKQVEKFPNGRQYTTLDSNLRFVFGIDDSNKRDAIPPEILWNEMAFLFDDDPGAYYIHNGYSGWIPDWNIAQVLKPSVKTDIVFSSSLHSYFGIPKGNRDYLPWNAFSGEAIKFVGKPQVYYQFPWEIDWDWLASWSQVVSPNTPLYEFNDGLQYYFFGYCSQSDDCSDGFYCLDEICVHEVVYVAFFEGKTFSFPDWDNGAFTRIDGVIGWVPSWELIDKQVEKFPNGRQYTTLDAEARFAFGIDETNKRDPIPPGILWNEMAFRFDDDPAVYFIHNGYSGWITTWNIVDVLHPGIPHNIVFSSNLHSYFGIPKGNREYLPWEAFPQEAIQFSGQPEVYFVFPDSIGFDWVGSWDQLYPYYMDTWSSLPWETVQPFYIFNDGLQYYFGV